VSSNLKGPIAASELIISDRGTIYHIDLAPEHIANTIITVGDPDRVKEVSKYFDSITHKAQHREFVTHTGYIGSKHLSVVSTGIGPDNIDIVLNELDALVNIDLETRMVKERHTSLSIIRMGTCGCLQGDVPVDSLVVSTYGLGLDNLMHYYPKNNTAAELALLAAFDEQIHTDTINVTPYINAGSERLRSLFTEGYTHGITVTCPGFYGPQGRVLRTPLAYPDLPGALTGFRDGEQRITNFEMETSAIYGLGRLLGHECLSISTVVANRVTQTFSKDGNAAVARMIEQSLGIIAS
jgi:uridine phosphorylase